MKMFEEITYESILHPQLYAIMRVWETCASEDGEGGHRGDRRNRQKLVNKELLRS